MQTKKRQKEKIILSTTERLPLKYTDISYDLNK